MMQKVVLKLHLHDDKEKKKAMKIVSGFEGVDSISVDKDMKLTVTGEIDPVKLTGKLRKLCTTEIVSVGPAKEEKKDDKKKEDNKKEDSKDNKKGDDKDKKGGAQQNYPQLFYPPQHYYPQYYYQQHPMQAYYYGQGGRNYSQEEDPSSCVIC